MNYYKAREQDTPPYVVFDLVATSAQKLEQLGLTDSPLVVREAQLTDSEDAKHISYEFGICHVRIQNGELVPRPVEEVNTADTQLTKALRVADTKGAIEVIQEETFTFDGQEFPMNEGAAKRYEAIFNSPKANYDLISINGPYTLISESIDTFKQSYYNRLLFLSNTILR